MVDNRSALAACYIGWNIFNNYIVGKLQMNNEIYNVYAHQKKQIERTELCPNQHTPAKLNWLADMKLCLTILEEERPEYLMRYMAEQELS